MKSFENLNEGYDENWDQFETNENKFNVKTTYDDKFYTTTIDENKIPQHVKSKADVIYDVNKNYYLN